jgi:hypothetical protein
VRLRSRAPMTPRTRSLLGTHCPRCRYAALLAVELEDGTTRVHHILTQVFPCDIPPATPEGKPS